MARVIILGTANAVSNRDQENTYWMAISGQRGILVDCPGNPVVQLQKAGVAPNRVTDIVLTHFHPDHVSGFSLLLLDMWLMGRKDDLHVYGLTHTIDRAEQMMELFQWRDWPGFFQVHYHRLPEEPMHLFMEDADVRVFSSPVKHFLPTIGIRMEFPCEGKIIAYSADTEPTDALIDLSLKADLLIHEGTGASEGHSSAEQAGEVASKAQVRALLLIHYSLKDNLLEMVQSANKTFTGPVHLAKDLMTINLDQSLPTDEEGLPLSIFP